MDLVIAPLELKLADASATTEPGTFSGYAAVFGNVDSHGDIIAPGAFTSTLERRAASGRKNVPMHVQHAILGGDGLPIGVWSDIAEDSKGLKVKGKISGMDTDAGRLHYARLKDGAYAGLSIGFRTTKSSSLKGIGGGKRLVESVELNEISLVTDPSNAEAIIHEVKSRDLSLKAAVTEDNTSKAATSIANAMRLHDTSMGKDSYSYSSPADKAKLMNHLRDAHEALTGLRAPDGLEDWKSSISRDEYISGVKSAFGLSDTQAASMADLVLKVSSSDRSAPDVKAAADLSFLSSFKLPSF